MFKTGQTSASDEEWSGCPSTSTTKGNTQHVCTPILDNRKVTTHEVVNQLLICHISAYEIILPSPRLHLHNVCVRWISKQLMEQYRGNHSDICNCLLNWYHEKNHAFSSHSVTWDQMWLCYYNWQRKYQSMEWKYTTSPSKKNLKSQWTAGKLVLKFLGFAGTKF
jgi:hypothetical protein